MEIMGLYVVGYALIDSAQNYLLDQGAAYLYQLYDASYVALAQQYKTKFLTADEKLHDRIRQKVKAVLLSEIKLISFSEKNINK